MLYVTNKANITSKNKMYDKKFKSSRSDGRFSAGNVWIMKMAKIEMHAVKLPRVRLGVLIRVFFSGVDQLC